MPLPAVGIITPRTHAAQSPHYGEPAGWQQSPSTTPGRCGQAGWAASVVEATRSPLPVMNASMSSSLLPEPANRKDLKPSTARHPVRRRPCEGGAVEMASPSTRSVRTSRCRPGEHGHRRAGGRDRKWRRNGVLEERADRLTAQYVSHTVGGVQMLRLAYTQSSAERRRVRLAGPRSPRRCSSSKVPKLGPVPKHLVAVHRDVVRTGRPRRATSGREVSAVRRSVATGGAVVSEA